MTENLPWPHRWFGFWAEDGRGYEHCPSVAAWPLSELDEKMLRLCAYLEQGQIVCVGQVPKRACVICGEVMPLSRTLLSDGKWLWPEDLVHYLGHGIVVPHELLEHFESNKEVPIVGVRPEALDWPSHSRST
jgi:hypothetical protein